MTLVSMSQLLTLKTFEVFPEAQLVNLELITKKYMVLVTPLGVLRHLQPLFTVKRQ